MDERKRLLDDTLTMIVKTERIITTEDECHTDLTDLVKWTAENFSSPPVHVPSHVFCAGIAREIINTVEIATHNSLETLKKLWVYRNIRSTLLKMHDGDGQDAFDYLIWLVTSMPASTPRIKRDAYAWRSELIASNGKKT